MSQAASPDDRQISLAEREGAEREGAVYDDRAGTSAGPGPALEQGPVIIGSSPGPSGGDVSLVNDPATLRRRWESVQVSFVDDPRRAVAEAEALVSATIDEIVAGFKEQRQRLEAGWSQGEPSTGAGSGTEEMRTAFRRYRAFFDRLVAI
jgi:hypothetical protein